MDGIVSLHVTHQWADIEELELASKEAETLLDRLMGLRFVEEAVILKTCNRVEIYLATDNAEVTVRAVREILGEGAGHDDLAGHVRFLHDRASVEHLFRVACGIESMVVGEDQILGQVKEALAYARERESLGPVLDEVFTKAVHVGKRARTETDINRGSVSVGSAAVDLAERLLGGLADRTVMVIGAGETATLVAKALSRHDLHAIFVANRTRSHAEDLARALGGIAIDYDRIGDHLPGTDVLISATAAPHVVLSAEDLAAMRGAGRTGDAADRPLLIVDIAQPRDIDEAAADLPGVALHNLDSLKDLSRESLEQRRREVERVEEIVQHGLDSLKVRFARRDVEDLIRDLYREALRVREEEVAKALRKADFDREQARVVEDLTSSIVNRLLARPTETLKRASVEEDRQTIRAGERLLGVGEEDEEPEASGEADHGATD